MGVALAPGTWFEKARIAVGAARVLLDAGNLPGMANRAYYGLFAWVTGVLLEMGLEAPPRHGNWPHEAMPWLIRRHCRPSALRQTAMDLWDGLYRARVLADYDDHALLDGKILELWLRRLQGVVGSDWRGF